MATEQAKLEGGRGGFRESTTLRHLTPIAFPSMENIGTRPNPFKGIRFLEIINSGTSNNDRSRVMHAPRIFSLALDGQERGYIALTETPDGTPTGITVVTSIPIPNPESPTSVYHGGIMLTRDPETNVTQIKGVAYPTEGETGEYCSLPPRDAMLIGRSIDIYGQPLDPVDAFLQTASIYNALQNLSPELHFGSVDRVLQMLSEARTSLLETGFPKSDHAPIPSSVDITIESLTNGNQTSVDFRVHTGKHHVDDDYSVVTGKDEQGKYIIITNETKGITYYTDGNQTIVYSPSGRIEVGGLESVRILRGMEETIGLAMKAVDMNIHYHASNSAFATSVVIENSKKQIKAALRREKLLRIFGRVVEKVSNPHRDFDSTKKPRTRMREAAGKIREIRRDHLSLVSKNDQIAREVHTAFAEAKALANQLKPTGEIVLEEGQRAETEIMRDQISFGLENASIATDNVGNLHIQTPIGSGTIELQSGKLTTTIQMVHQRLMLTLDTVSGKISLVKKPDGTNSIPMIAEINDDFGLYMAGLLSLNLNEIIAEKNQRLRITGNVNAEAILPQSVETVQEATIRFMSTIIAKSISLIHPMLSQLRVVEDPRTQGDYMLFGERDEISGQVEGGPNIAFTLSTPEVGEGKRQLQLTIESDEQRVVDFFFYNGPAGTPWISVQNPYGRPPLHIAVPLVNTVAAKKLTEFVETILGGIGANDHYDMQGTQPAARLKIARSLGLADLSDSQFVALGKIESLLRSFNRSPLRSLPPARQDEWTLTPGEIPAFSGNTEMYYGGRRTGFDMLADLLRRLLRINPVNLVPSKQTDQLHEGSLEQKTEELRKEALTELATGVTSWIL